MHKFTIISGLEEKNLKGSTKVLLNGELIECVRSVTFHADVESDPVLTLQIVRPEVEIINEIVVNEIRNKTTGKIIKFDNQCV